MKLPTVLAIENLKPDEVMLRLAVSAGLEAFQGHFPDNPLLPGVVQIDWAVRFAALHLGIQPPAAWDIQVKFRNVIRPGDPLALTLQVNRAKGQLAFAYQSSDTIMSSGQIKLGAEK